MGSEVPQMSKVTRVSGNSTSQRCTISNVVAKHYRFSLVNTLLWDPAIGKFDNTLDDRFPVTIISKWYKTKTNSDKNINRYLSKIPKVASRANSIRHIISNAIIKYFGLGVGVIIIWVIEQNNKFTIFKYSNNSLPIERANK